MVLVAVVTDSIGEKQSLVCRASGEVGVPQKQVSRCQLQVDEQAVWLIVQQIEELRECEQKLSKIFILNLWVMCELTKSMHEFCLDGNTNLRVLLVSLSITHVIPCLPIHRLIDDL